MSIRLVQNLFFIKHLRKRSLQAEFLKPNLSAVTVRKKIPQMQVILLNMKTNLFSLTVFLLRHINQSCSKAAHFEATLPSSILLIAAIREKCYK